MGYTSLILTILALFLQPAYSLSNWYVGSGDDSLIHIQTKMLFRRSVISYLYLEGKGGISLRYTLL